MSDLRSPAKVTSLRWPLAVLGAAVAVSAAGCRDAGRPALPPSPRAYVAPLVDAESRAVYLEASVNGRGPYLYKVDTGAAHCSLARDVAEEAGVRRVGSAPLVHVDAHGMRVLGVMGEIDTLWLGGGLVLRGVRCLLPERPPRRHAGLRVVGLLGMSVLAGLELTIDRDRGVLVVRTGSDRVSAAPRGAVSVPIAYAPGDRRMARPSVPIWIAGRPLAFLLDTGASRTHVDAQLGHALGLPLDRSIAAVSTAAHSSRLVVGAFQAERLWLGPLSVRRHLLWPLGSSQAMPPKVSGLLGMDVLGRYNVTIDLRRAQLHLWPRLPASLAVARLGRWGDRLSSCAAESGCLRVSPLMWLSARRGPVREGFVVESKRPLTRPLRALFRVSDGTDAAAAGLFRGGARWLSASLLPAPGRRRWEVPLPELSRHRWDDPVLAPGADVELVDASPFVGDCPGPVCARWEASP